jgi:RNA polymerase-associated protein RTF1
VKKRRGCLSIAYARYNVCVVDFAPVTVPVHGHQGVSTQVAKPYKINNQSMNHILELKHGSLVKALPMDRISNAPFQQVSARCVTSYTLLDMHAVLQKEFDRVVRVWQSDSIKLPTKRHIEQKIAQRVKLMTMPMTEVFTFICLFR